MSTGSLCVVAAALLLLVLGLGAPGSEAANCTVCLSGSCDSTTISGGIALTTSDGEVVDVAPGIYDQEVSILVNQSITLRLGSNEADTVTVVHSGAWLTVANASTLVLQLGELVLQGARLVVDADGQLNQSSDVVFNGVQGPSAIAILADAVWVQNGNVEISNTTVTEALVDLAGGVWQQYGNATLVATHGVSGVRFGPGSFSSRWFQRGINNISVTSPSTNQIAAVDMSAGGMWLHMQDGPRIPHSHLTVSGSASSGVHLGSDGSWGQYGLLTVQASNQSTGVVLNSTGVWTTTALSTFNLAASTGIRFVGATAKLSQQRNFSISAGRDATGIEFANGGSWRQFATTTVKTTSATALGVKCSSSASCCSQVGSPTLVKIFSTQSTGRENDCTVSSSPLPVASVAPLTADTKASFDDNSSAVAISSSPAGATNASSVVGVQLSLSGLQLGFTDLQGLNVTRTVTNTTDPSNGNATTSTFAYTTHLDAETSLVQSYTYYASDRAVSSAGVDFTVRAGSVKWSFSLTTATMPSKTASVADAQTNGFSLRYRLSDLASSSSSSSSSSGPSRITRRRNTPRAGMTTFFVALSDDGVVAQLEVLNAAVIDGTATTLGRIELVFDNVSATNNQSGYFLELDFPPFRKTVVYDPSLGLGVLLGRSSDGSPSSSTDVGLIVGVAVAIPVAVVVVLAAIVVGVVLAWRRRSRWANGAANSTAVDLALDESERGDRDQL